MKGGKAVKNKSQHFCAWLAALCGLCMLSACAGAGSAEAAHAPSPAAAQAAQETSSAAQAGAAASELPGGESGGDNAPYIINGFDLSKNVLQVRDRSVGAAYVERYYFTKSGWFCYITTGYGVSESGQLLSQRGQWRLTDENHITLLTLEEKVAEGGEAGRDALGYTQLQNYREVRREVNTSETREISIEQDKIGDYVKMGDLSLFPSIPYDEAMEVFAEQGYEGYAALPIPESDKISYFMPE